MPPKGKVPDVTVTREKVAKFLYRNDGNHNLPQPRIWGWLSPFWQDRYLELADELLEELTEEPYNTVTSITS